MPTENSPFARIRYTGPTSKPPMRQTGLENLEGDAFKQALVAKWGPEKAAQMLARLGR